MCIEAVKTSIFSVFADITNSANTFTLCRFKKYIDKHIGFVRTASCFINATTKNTTTLLHKNTHILFAPCLAAAAWLQHTHRRRKEEIHIRTHASRAHTYLYFSFSHHHIKKKFSKWLPIRWKSEIFFVDRKQKKFQTAKRYSPKT